MPALPARLGIVAGGGKLPQKLVEFCDSQKIETFLIGFENQTDPTLLEGRTHEMTRLGAAGQIITILRDHQYIDLVLIGSIKRPKLSELRPDLRTASFFAKLGLRVLGDDGLLKAIRAELEEEGFIIHGIHELMPELLMPQGVLTTVAPTPTQKDDIALGLKASKKIGKDDIGQSVVVLNNEVIGVEDDNGTNDLIRRAAKEAAILVKSCKPQQDRKLDMPTIGPDTIKLCASLGYAGIAAEAGDVLVVDRDHMVSLANDAGLFILGV
jgi:DUF1009 family protein